MQQELRSTALHLLSIRDPILKGDGVARLREDYLNHRVTLDLERNLTDTGVVIPGRPEIPILVNPGLVKRRSMHTQEGRAVLIHALAHIEFNAINLALDAIWRFSGMPQEYYEDWLKIAQIGRAHV